MSITTRNAAKMIMSELEYDSFDDDNDTQNMTIQDCDFYWEDKEYDAKIVQHQEMVPEPISLRKRSDNIVALNPIQLTSKSSKFDTIHEMIEAYEIENEETLREIEISHEKNMIALKQREKEMLKADADFQAEKEEAERKLAEAEKKLKENENPKSDKAKPKTKPRETTSLPFGHRRNGGGKHRNNKQTDETVIKARRALRRKEAKDKKRDE